MRASTAARSLIISYGIAAFGLLMLRSDAPGMDAAGARMFVAGIVIQMAVWIANAVARRHIPDVESAARWQYMIALLADGLTVACFAIGTFRAIAGVTSLP